MTERKDEELGALVSLIYENAFAPKSWGGLVGDGSDGEEEAGPGRGRSADDAIDPSYLERIMPYLDRAIDLGGREQDFHKVQTSRAALFRDIPIAVCVVSSDFRVLSKNDKADEVLSMSDVFEVRDESLEINSQRLRGDLQDAVTGAIDEKLSRIVTLGPSLPSRASSVLVAPVSGAGEVTPEPSAILFFDFDRGNITDLALTLADAHGLTTSEAETAAYLAQGYSLDEIAKIKKCSINTVRTQIKQAFAKTGVKRQGELVSLVLNGPAMWLRLLDVDMAAPGLGLAVPPGESNVCRLRDGRDLGYGDYGPRDGTVVFLFHHLHGSRKERPSDPELLNRMNIRLIVPERPGIGLSSSCGSRKLIDGSSDVRELADHLDIEQFHVLGFSSGGPHAAACGAAMPERVFKVGLAASLMPFDELPGNLRPALVQRFVVTMSRHWRPAMLQLLELRYRRLLESPDEALAQFKREGNGPDRALLQDPVINRTRQRFLRDASGVPKRIFAEELVMLFRPWGFLLEDLKMPVLIWHGEQDDFFPADQARAMTSILSNYQVDISPDRGHFFLYAEWEAILSRLIEV